MKTRPLHQQYIIYKPGGGGGTDPDPALFCPPHGYYTPGTFVLPDDITPAPDPEGQEITLLCTDQVEGVVCFRVLVTGGYTVRIYNTANTLLQQSNHTTNSDFFVDLVALGGGSDVDGMYSAYIIRITPQAAGAPITRFYRNTRTGYTGTNWPIIQAKFNTPDITGLQNAFQNLKLFASLVINSTMNSLANINQMCSGCENLEQVVFPTALPALTNISNSFNNCNSLIEITMPTSLDSLVLFVAVFIGSAKLKKVNMPTYVPLVESLQTCFQNCPSLVHGKLPLSMPSLINMNATFSGCTNLVEATLPLTLSAWEGGATFQNCNYLAKINNWPAALPSVASLINTFTGIFRLPDLPTTTFPATTIAFQQSNTLSWTSFNQPSLRASAITITGTSTTVVGKLEYVEIDWGNSDFSGTSPQISFRYQSLQASEIDRIFNALPTLSGKTINVQNNPGSAACNPSIASAKGWTVQR